jgi:hypothetical protein
MMLLRLSIALINVCYFMAMLWEIYNQVWIRIYSEDELVVDFIESLLDLLPISESFQPLE